MDLSLVAGLPAGVAAGKVQIDWLLGRLLEVGTKRFLGAVAPSPSLQKLLSALPFDPKLAFAALTTKPEFAGVSSMITGASALFTQGALASIAGLGATLVGFDVVLTRLQRLDGKLDELLSSVDALKQAVADTRVEINALSLARLRSAAESLDRALAAEGTTDRRELARRARDLFQESRLYHLELWKAAKPWLQVSIPLRTCLEMQSRYTACAIGEIQAEFLLGDRGAFRHASKSAADTLRETYGLDVIAALRARSDAIAGKGALALALFSAELPATGVELTMALETTKFSADRLDALADDAELPHLLGREPQEIVQLSRAAKGVEVVVIAPKETSITSE